MKISILESLGVSQEKLSSLMKPFEDNGHVFSVHDRTLDVDRLVENVGDSDVAIIANMPFGNEVVERCPNLKFIDVAFTGVDHVGLDASKANGIAVSNASGYSNEAVAELGVSMALTLLRNVREVEARCREGKTKDGLVGSEIKGKTVGIVGLGKIGSRSAELFNAFGAKVLASSRTIHPDAPFYVEQVGLEELLKRSDIVVLHCPLNIETKGLIDKNRLALMKKSAILINLARGPVVASSALAEALKAVTIAGAGIDVFDKEPPLPVDDPLLAAPNALVTPHVAFATRESMEIRADIVFDNLSAWIEGKQKNVVL